MWIKNTDLVEIARAAVERHDNTIRRNEMKNYGPVEINYIRGDEVEFTLGEAVAYGTFYETSDGAVYSVDHAPSQEWFDIIAKDLDAETERRERTVF